MDWFILALLAGTASNMFNVVNRSTLRERGDSTLYSWLFEVFRLAIFMCAFVVNPTLPKHLSTYGWLVALGINEAASVYFFMKSHKHTKLSLSTFLIKLQLIWTPLLAYVLINERLNSSDYLGIGIILLGIFIGVYSPRMKADKGIVITFISSVFISLNAVFTKAAAGDASTPFILLMMSLPSVLVFPFLMKSFAPRIRTMSGLFVKSVAASVVFNVVAMSLAVSAIRLGSTSKVTAVYQGMMIVSVLYGIIVLREKEHIAQKLIGTAITLFGLALLA